MIIEQVTVQNYMCYYDSNVFEFEKGLNIILGENGEGKTKFFEAMEWMIVGGNQDLESMISAKKLKETHDGDSFSVSVSLRVKQHEEIRTISRSFIVTKKASNEASLSQVSFSGVIENRNGERSNEDANRLLGQVFPAEIRKYSMFKGEAELNVFENEDALINLINLFSNAKHFDAYAQAGEGLRASVEKAVAAETRRNNQNEREYRTLLGSIESTMRERDRVKLHLSEIEDQVDKIEANLQKAEKHVDNAEALEVINERIRNIERKKREAESLIKERYTTYLFDNSWILNWYEPIFNVYKDKVNAWSQIKRKEEQKFFKKQGELEGVVKLLSDDTLHLDFNVPNKEVMEELIRDKHCKVCNTPAPDPSPQLDFMKARLEKYLESQKPSSGIEENLFIHDYLRDMINMMNLNNDSLADLRKVDSDIKELFDFNQQRLADIDSLEAALNRELGERTKVLGESSGGEDKLGNVLKNYNGWQADLKDQLKQKGIKETRLEELDLEMKELSLKKDKTDLESANSFLIRSRDVIRDMATIFEDTKKTKFHEVVKQLEDKSNNYFNDINKSAFTGHIVFQYRELASGKVKIDVELHYGDGRKLHKPNQSLETSMHIAVLFAISKLAEKSQEESFPLIMDAPTSSFGETKTGEFLNIISKTEGQIIILLKDFLSLEKKTQTINVKPEFSQIKRSKGMWVRLDRPFDSDDLTTLNTEVINL